MNRALPRRAFLQLSTPLAVLALGCTQKGPPAAAQSEGEVPLPDRKTTQIEMPTRPLGKTGVEVSMIGVGGFHLGKAKDEAESTRIVRTAIDRGVTFMDNCWDYNGGESEARMGKGLGDGYRQRAFLMTKLDGRTKASALEQLDQSLRRLQTDVIDLVQIHEVIRPEDPARCFAPGGCIEALVHAKKAGKLRFIGFTGHKLTEIHLAMLKQAEDHGFEFDTVQMPLNVMDAHFRSFEKQVLPALLDRRIGVLGMKSMGSGLILKSKTVSAVECLHYAMNLRTSVVITGCESVGVLEQAIAAALSFRPMPPEEVATLLARTRDAAREGEFEKFKTSQQFDGTAQNPKWLERAEI